MNRNWMKANRESPEYERGVVEFLRFAERNLPPPESDAAKNLPPPPESDAEKNLPPPPESNVLFLCPCVVCQNREPKLDKEKIKSHLIGKGICQNYKQWTWHGEVEATPSVSQRENISVDVDDRLEDMMRDIGEDSFKRAHVYDTLCSDKEIPLYLGCTNFTCLSAVLKLFNLKAKNGWTDKSFTELLELFVEETEKGTFVPNGRDDILSKALEKPEHGGQVGGVGRGANFNNYFGRSLRSTPNIIFTEQFSQLEKKIRADLETKLRADLEDKMNEQLQLMQQPFIDFSQTASQANKVVEECSPKNVLNGNVKASCSSAPVNMKELETDNDSVQKLFSMIKKRKKHVAIQLEHDACVTNFKMSPMYIKDLLVGDKMLDYSILQLWCTYMHRLSIETNKSDLYAFLDPCQLDFAKNINPLSTQKTGKEYLQTKLRDLKKVCYLVPHFCSEYWQLIIMCPKDNIIVCICSLHKEIDETTKDVVAGGFKDHCGIKKKPITWIFPKTRVQSNGDDSGYYVMKNMIDIVSAKITKSWKEVFNKPEALTGEELYELRNRCAACFLDIYNPKIDILV